MFKGKHFNRGFEPTRNGHDAAGAAEHWLRVPTRLCKIPSGIVLLPSSKMVCVAREFD
jgi:hypothetical protein